MMTLKELKEFLNNLPEEFDTFGLVNGEVGVLDDSGEDDEPNYIYRCDKPIITLYVDEVENEICFFHQTQDEIDEVVGSANEKED